MRFPPPTDQKCVESSTYWQFFYYRPPGKFRFTHLGEIVKMLCQELDIYILYIYIEFLAYNIYDALDNRYGFSISVQHGIDCTTFHSFFSSKVWKKMFFKICLSWQVCDWLAKWIIMLRFMDLRWPRVFRRSNVGLFPFSHDSDLGPFWSRQLWGLPSSDGYFYWNTATGNNSNTDVSLLR